MKKNAGFTLIEIMIVIGIIAIIAAIAAPSYMEKVRETRRAEAASALVQLSQAMERFYTVNFTYEGAAAGGADTGAPAVATFGTSQSPATGEAHYNLEITAASPTDYTLSATPISNSQTSDKCGILTLTSTNVRGDAGPPDIRCWR